MEIDNLFGLPAHPLLVHAAVVLLPLAALATLAVAVIPRSRRHYAPIALVLALAALASVALAQGSGEALEERVAETELVEAHADQGESVLPWAIALTVVAAATTGAAVATRRWPRITARNLTAGLVLAATITSVGATWTVTDVGHSGAKAAWDDTPDEAGDDEGDSAEDYDEADESDDD